MDNAAALLDTIQSMVFVDNAIGIKSMIRVLEFVEFHVMLRGFITLPVKAVYACPNTSKWLMELALPAHFILPIAQLPNLVFAILATFLTSVSVLPHAILMSNS